MATAPQINQLPLFYNDMVPLNKGQHGAWRTRTTDKAPWLAGQHAVPLTVEEFPVAQRYFPIVFSSGEQAVPLALMGLNEGVNVFVQDDGTVDPGIYVPAYARRYPFMLARMRTDSEELTLCFDPSTDLIGGFDDGIALFDGDEPSEATNATLKFCEQFEIAGQKTAAFAEELDKHGLLIDGQLTVGLPDSDEPFVYRGFRMVDEAKLKEIRGDVLRGWAQSGLLPLVYAHLHSLEIAREIFARQHAMGKVPLPQPAA
jgi:hypothetical protein